MTVADKSILEQISLGLVEEVIYTPGEKNIWKVSEKCREREEKASEKTLESVVKENSSVVKDLNKRRESGEKMSGKILAACRERSTITIPELAAQVGVTGRSVQRHLQILQKNGLLCRVGGRKIGYWEVLA